MHEIALFVDNPHKEGGALVDADALRDPVPELSESLTEFHVSALSSCLVAIDTIFETFLALDIFDVRCLPIFNFVRVAYAVVVLIKMYFSASSPNSVMGVIIDKDNMKVVENLEKLLEKLRETAASNKSRPAAKFREVLAMARGWFHEQGSTHPPNDGNISGSPDISQNQQDQHRNQPQQNNQQPGYGPANTPLQLLSEIATGNGQISAQLSSSDVNAVPYPYFMTGPQQPNNLNLGLPAPPASREETAAMSCQPWMSSWTNWADYNHTGDGFEQAMEMTMIGLRAAGNAPLQGKMENDA